MSPPIDIAGLEGARAIVLHPAHDRLPVLLRQLRAIGLEVETAWPTLPASAITADFILYDTDAGHDPKRRDGSNGHPKQVQMHFWSSRWPQVASLRPF